MNPLFPHLFQRPAQTGDSALSEPRQPGAVWHVPALDGLRGIAALLIVCYHAPVLMDLQGRQSTALGYSMLRWGWTAVDLFFVVSGFLITSLLLKARGRSGALRQFWIRRGLRILPLAWLYVGVHLLLALWLPSYQTFLQPELILSMFTWTLNFWISAHGWVSHSIDPFWSLAVEEQFYLIWPLCMFFVPLHRLSQGLWAFVLLSPLLRLVVTYFSPYPTAYVLPFSHGDGLALGCLLAMELAQPQRAQVIAVLSQRLLPLASATLLGLSLLGNKLYAIRADWRLNPWLYSVVAFCCAIGVAWVVTHPERVPRVLVRGPMLWLGQRTYGLYVWHTLTGALLLEGWNAMGLPRASEGLRLACWLVILVIVVELSWRLLEKPCLALKDRLASAEPRSRDALERCSGQIHVDVSERGFPAGNV